MVDHLAAKLNAVSDLIRFTKPYGTLLLLWPSLWSLAIAAEGRPSVKLVGLFCLGAFVMRSAGCAMNDLADRKIDAHVDRTKMRPLPSGRITAGEALAIIGFLLVIAALIVWHLPPLARWLSLPALALAAGYPFAKRLFPAPQLVLGVAFGWGVPMAWAAVHDSLELTTWLLFFATVFWATAYDTIYALMDCQDDNRLQVHSTARLFGRFTWLAVGILGALMLATLVWAGTLAGLDLPYALALLVVAFLFLYQMVRVKMGGGRETAFRLFKAHVGVGLIILLGIEIDYTIAFMISR